nr:hypothetical protein [Tanacetum cinerariifolium]
MCMSYTDVAQVANAARNYKILHERDDDDIERPDKRQKSGDRHQPTSQQSSHRNHGHNNDRHGSDRRGISVMGVTRETGVSSPTDLLILSRGPSEGYSYPVCTTCGRRHPGECRRAAGTCFKCGQTGHLQKDYKKNTTASTSGQADKKPGASGRVFAITEDHATKTSGTITDTLFIYRYAVFVLFDTGATHSVISSVFASRVTTTPTLLDHVLCISTPMQDSVRITHVYKDIPLQFDDKIHAINAFPLDMCEFDIILGIDWLTKHHATIDCRSYRVIFGDIHAPEFIYHGSLLGKSMQIIFALQARTLPSHGCEGFSATIHDMTSDVPSIHDQPIVSEFPDVFPDELPGIPPVRENTDAAAFDVKEPESKVHVSPSKFSDISTNGVNAASTPVTDVGQNSTNSTNTFSAAGPSNNTVSLNFKLGGKSSYVDPSQYPGDPDMPDLEDITYSDDEEDVGVEADFSNLETNITVSPI